MLSTLGEIICFIAQSLPTTINIIQHSTQQIMAPALVMLRKVRYTAAVASRVSPGKTASLYSSSPWFLRCCDRFAHIGALFEIQGQHIPARDTHIDNQAAQISWKHHITQLLPCISFITWLLNSRMATSAILILSWAAHFKDSHFSWVFGHFVSIPFPFRNTICFRGAVFLWDLQSQSESHVCVLGTVWAKIISLQVKDPLYTPWNLT